MLFTEFNLETAKEVWLEEGREEGFEEGTKFGAERKAIDLARKLLVRGFSPEQIAEDTELPIEQIIALQHTMNTND